MLDVGSGKVKTHARTEKHGHGIVRGVCRLFRLQNGEDPNRLIKVERAACGEEPIARRSSRSPAEAALTGPIAGPIQGLDSQSSVCCAHRISWAPASGAQRFHSPSMVLRLATTWVKVLTEE